MAMHFDKTLVRRLERASRNGSKIASAILDEINNNESPLRSKGDYFDGLKVWHRGHSSYSIWITFCNKDWNHPEAASILQEHETPWLMKEYRQKISPAKFVTLFKNLPTYTDLDIQFFASALELESDIEVKIEEGNAAFKHAYDERNYFGSHPSGSSLHSSCMRYSNRARQCGSFYGDLANIKIIVATIDGAVVGRALYWDDVEIYPAYEAGWIKGPADKMNLKPTYEHVKIMDRAFYTTEAVGVAMKNFATQQGIMLRKNTGSGMNFTALDPKYHAMAEQANRGSVVHWIHMDKAFDLLGYPYLDTFKDLAVIFGRPALVCGFKNLEDSDRTKDELYVKSIAELRSTDGSAGATYNLPCRVCGGALTKSGSREYSICTSCLEKICGDAISPNDLPRSYLYSTYSDEWRWSFRFNNDSKGLMTEEEYFEELSKTVKRPVEELKQLINLNLWRFLHVLENCDVTHECEDEYDSEYEDDYDDEDDAPDYPTENMEDEEFDESDYPD